MSVRLRNATLLVLAILLASVANAAAASLSIVSTALTPYQTCILTAYPNTTTGETDAIVAQGFPTTNIGTQTFVAVSSASAANARTYLRFDLTRCNPAVPASATVRQATLRLFPTALPAACRTDDIFAVTAAWTETGITWNNQPFGTAINNPPTASRSGSFNAGAVAGCQNATTTAYTVGGTVTSDVQAFVAGSRTNNGWMLRDDVEGSATTWTAQFAGKRASLVNEDPQLVITYVTVP